MKSLCLYAEIAAWTIEVLEILMHEGRELWFVEITGHILSESLLKKGSVLTVSFGKPDQLKIIYAEGISHVAYVELTKSAMIENAEIINSPEWSDLWSQVRAGRPVVHRTDYPGPGNFRRNADFGEQVEAWYRLKPGNH